MPKWMWGASGARTKIGKSFPLAASLALVSLSASAADPTPPQSKNPVRWIGPLDYPAEALRQGLQGRVRLVITVDEHGRPTACEVTSSSGSELLDSYSCNLILKRAEYYPARDADGMAVSGKSEFGFAWLLPGSEKLPPAAIRLAFSRDGKVSKCRWVQRPAPKLDPWQFCNEFAGSDPLDPFGKPPRGQAYLEVDQSRIDALLKEAEGAEN